jgi:hypothetical protein
MPYYLSTWRFNVHFILQVPSALTCTAPNVLATGFTCVLLMIFCINSNYFCKRRSQWPRGLRRGSAVIRLLEVWARIPPEAWMFVLWLLYKDSSMGNKWHEDGRIWKYKMDQSKKSRATKRIPLGPWMSGSSERCVLLRTSSCVGLITRPTECYRVRCV